MQQRKLRVTQRENLFMATALTAGSPFFVSSRTIPWQGARWMSRPKNNLEPLQGTKIYLPLRNANGQMRIVFAPPCQAALQCGFPTLESFNPLTQFLRGKTQCGFERLKCLMQESEILERNFDWICILRRISLAANWKPLVLNTRSGAKKQSILRS